MASSDGASNIAPLIDAFGFGLLTLSIPSAKSTGALSRLMLMVAVGFLAYRLDASTLASPRLRVGLQFGDSSAKAHAIRGLTSMGLRDFDGTQLVGVDLFQADVSHAKFSGADLAGADLSGAQAMESRFDDATLADAVIRGADLSLSNADTAHGWTTTKCDAKTRFPDGWRCDGEQPVRAKSHGSNALP